MPDKRPKTFVIVDDSSLAVARAKLREQRVPSSFHVKTDVNTKWTATGPAITKIADRKTIMNYHTRGQTRKTIIDYHEDFEHAQTE